MRVPTLFAVILLPGIAHATTYYASPSGNDAAPGTENAPFQSIAHGASVLAPGDTLLVRAGTYAEDFYNGIPGGSSWSLPVTLAAYPGEKPVIRPAAGADRVFTFASAESSYVVIDGFVLDASNVTIDAIKITWGSTTGASHHIRIQHCEIFGAPAQGILVGGEAGKNGLDASGNEFLGLDVHDNGTTDFDHGFYITSAGNLVDGCRVHENAGWGIHVFNGSSPDADDNVIRNNRSYDNAAAGDRGVGIGIYSGSGTVAYNNLIWGNKAGIILDYEAAGAGVFNNVVVDNLETGVLVGQDSSDALVQNNAVWQNGTGIDDTGTGTTLDHNLVDIDPAFVDAANRDFHPTAGSPLVDQGIAIPTVASDFDGIARPVGSAYDIGAFEYCPGCAGASGAGGTSGASGAGGGSSGSGGTGAGSSGGSTSGGGASPAGMQGSEDDGGCGCHTASRRPHAGWMLLWALGFLRRRKGGAR